MTLLLVYFQSENSHTILSNQYAGLQGAWTCHEALLQHFHEELAWYSNTLHSACAQLAFHCLASANTQRLEKQCYDLIRRIPAMKVASNKYIHVIIGVQELSDVRDWLFQPLM